MDYQGAVIYIIVIIIETINVVGNHLIFALTNDNTHH